jgi:hypothetical protein
MIHFRSGRPRGARDLTTYKRPYPKRVVQPSNIASVNHYFGFPKVNRCKASFLDFTSGEKGCRTSHYTHVITNCGRARQMAPVWALRHLRAISFQLVNTTVILPPLKPSSYIQEGVAVILKTNILSSCNR